MSVPTDRPVRVRVAPSPTGDPHVGTAYMALFNLAFARQRGGSFVLRLEDTDRARYRADSEPQIYDTLRWLGLDWDEGPDIGGRYAPYRQSERLDSYAPYVEQLLADGHAYYCWCSSERLARMRTEQQQAKLPTGYDRLCYGLTRRERARLPGFNETPVVRMLIPDDVPLTFTDLIRGEIAAPRPDDQVIRKADGFPSYHLAVVVDDHEMGITHVVRGEEWISSTPKHLLLHSWLGLDVPQIAHMPVLRNNDRSKISKRKNPAARLTWFREQGYLPEALVNFLALMAYPPPVHDREVFSFEEFVPRLDWTKINPAGPIFDLDKLGWLNGHYIRSLDGNELSRRIVVQLQADGILSADPDQDQLTKITAAAPLVQERMRLLTEATDLLGFLLVADDDLVVADDARAALGAGSAEVIAAAVSALAAADWTTASIEAALRTALVDRLGLKPRHAFTPLRVAVTGRRVSPPLFESMEILGRTSTLARLEGLGTTL
ncbi:MAG: glutamate--tRNA ligase [Microlunatus sp.]|nr:glutamate--tRNA ligase [Microlunatus sp.]